MNFIVNQVSDKLSSGVHATRTGDLNRLVICHKHLNENKQFLGSLSGATQDTCYLCDTKWYDEFLISLCKQLWLDEIQTTDSVYISGPMTGIPEHNIPAFHRMEAILNQRGCTVLSPARYDYGEDKLSYPDMMRRDIKMVCDATKMVCLAGSESSKGAMAEFQVAQIIGLIIYYEC